MSTRLEAAKRESLLIGAATFLPLAAARGAGELGIALLIALFALLIFLSSCLSKKPTPENDGSGDYGTERAAAEATADSGQNTAAALSEDRAERPTNVLKPTFKPAPSWFLPAGVIALIVAVLAFFASAAMGGGGDLFGGILVAQSPFLCGPAAGHLLVETIRQPPGERNAPRTAQPPIDSLSRLRRSCLALGQNVSALRPTAWAGGGLLSGMVPREHCPTKTPTRSGGLDS